jgi:ubiquinone/menaquinone biosynthesis C-methylase UbiE
MKSSTYLGKIGIKRRDHDLAWDEIDKMDNAKKIEDLVSGKLRGQWYDQIGKETQDYYNGIGGEVYEILQSGEYDSLARDMDVVANVFKGSKKILDAGCGTGIFSCWLASKYKNAVVDGVDFSDKMIERAGEHKKSLGLKNVRFQKGNMTKLPFQKGLFDAALCLHALFETEPDLALSEISNALADGGKIYAAMYWYGYAAVKNDCMKELAQLFKNAGFDISVSYADVSKEDDEMACTAIWKGKKTGEPKPIDVPYRAAMVLRSQF